MTAVNGTTKAGFEGVADAVAGAAEHGEKGLRVAATVDGEVVFDLWTGEGWNEDTLVCVFSVSKGPTALCAAMLHDRGLLDIEAPIASYWPEFAASGKDEVTVRHALTHTAGLVMTEAGERWTTPRQPPSREEICAEIAAAAPSQEPGTKFEYHGLTYGFITGELARRVDGRTLGTFLRDEVTKPRGIDYFIGVPSSEDHRCIDAIPFAQALGTHGETTVANWNSIPWRRFEIPAGGGYANGRAIADLYTAIPELLSKETLEQFTTPQLDPSIPGSEFVPMCLGFHRFPTLVAQYMGCSERSYGHSGAGGSLGFADPDRGVTFGLSKEQMLEPSPIAGVLVKALYASL